MGVSIISYAGKVWLGVATDKGLVPDPATIIANFHTEFEELTQLTQEMETAELRAVTAEPPASVETMIAMLDGAIARVTAVIDETEKVPPSTAAQQPERCQATTQAGRRCKNRAVHDSRFCHVHQNWATRIKP
jgi:hypothetical protein